MSIYTIGIDVGGTKTSYGLFDSKKRLVFKKKTPSRAELKPEEFFDEIIDNIKDIMQHHDITEGQLRGVGIGMPSFVLYEEGKIVKTANLPLIKDFHARNYMIKKLGGNIRIMLDNDAHTAALAEHRHGAGRGFRHMMYCPVSTGISSGIIINNELFRGRYGWAGESGHMIVSPGQGIECGCGNKGCLMSWCSGSMIVKHVQQRIRQGEKSILSEMAGSVEQINASHINEACELNDPLALWAVEQMALYMGVWLYNLYTTMNINCFILGGGLLNFGDKLFKKVRQIFDQYNHCDLPVYFKTAELGDDFGIIGAAELLF
jgi:glucokinase